MDFDIAGMVRHLAEIPAAIEVEVTRGLERVARMVEAEAKAEIGHYQDAAGPFAPWAPLADSTLTEKQRLGYAPPDNPLLREGDLRDSIDHEVDGAAMEATVGSNSDIAVYQEVGTSRIPPRPFLGGAAVRKEEAVADELGRSFVTGIVGPGLVRQLRGP